LQNLAKYPSPALICRADVRTTRRRIVTQKDAKLSRRNFLLTVGAGGAATAAAVVTGRKAAQGTATAQGKRGYQATAHVNNYYRTAKV
jgi:hypothetical protein